MKYLVVIDMQKDFVTGALGSAEAQAVVNNVVDKVKNFDGLVIYTKDTHQNNYMQTQEGKYLPVEHCIEGTDGWMLIPELESLREEKKSMVFDKNTFGSTALAASINYDYDNGRVDSVELIGVCTDICVVSNALLLKAYMPELMITVDSACCAGVTPQKHEAALETMRSCQINVI